MNRSYTHHKTEAERQKAIKESKTRYSKKKWSCDLCDVTIYISNRYTHRKSKKHIANLKTVK